MDIHKEEEMISFACTQRFILKMGLANVFVAFLVFLLFSSPQPVIAADLFVTDDGSGTSCSQSDPCSLATAMSQVADNDSVYMGAGRYTDSGDPEAVLQITQSLNIYGGWNGAPAGAVECDPELYPTIFDGQNGKRVVYISGTISVTLDGLTVENGLQTNANGAGLYSQNADLTLSNMVFDSNVINGMDNVDDASGGGAYVENGSLATTGCTFTENSAWGTKSSHGGGIAIKNTSTAAVENCVFEKNDAWIAAGLDFLNENSGYAPFLLRGSTFHQNGWGYSAGDAYCSYSGAIQIHQADARIEANIFTENRSSADYGAAAVRVSHLLFDRNRISSNQCGRTSGLYIHYCPTVTITNNIFSDNQSTYDWLQYPAVLVRGSTAQFLHNTLARNTGAYGIQLANAGEVNCEVNLTNNVIAGHTTGVQVDDGCIATMEATLWGSGIWANTTDWTGTGTINTETNFWDEPGFVDPDAGDYHIGPGSAARNAGVDTVVTKDIDGDVRPIGPGFDIGADENNGVAITPVLMLLLSE